MRLLPFSLVMLALIALAASAQPGRSNPPKSDWVVGQMRERLRDGTPAGVSDFSPGTWPIYRFAVWNVAEGQSLEATFKGDIRVAIFVPGDNWTPSGKMPVIPRTVRDGDVMMIRVTETGTAPDLYYIQAPGASIVQLSDEIPQDELKNGTLIEILTMGLFYLESNVGETLAAVARYFGDEKSDVLETMLLNLSITPQPMLELGALAVRSLRGDKEAEEEFVGRLAADRVITMDDTGSTLYGGEPLPPMMEPEPLLQGVIAEAAQAVEDNEALASWLEDAAAPAWVRAAGLR